MTKRLPSYHDERRGKKEGIHQKNFCFQKLGATFGANISPIPKHITLGGQPTEGKRKDFKLMKEAYQKGEFAPPYPWSPWRLIKKRQHLLWLSIPCPSRNYGNDTLDAEISRHSGPNEGKASSLHPPILSYIEKKKRKIRKMRTFSNSVCILSTPWGTPLSCNNQRERHGLGGGIPGW